MSSIIENQQLNEPVSVAALWSGEYLANIQASFILNEADFMRLQGVPARTEAWATNLLFAVVGYGISLAPKYWDSVMNSKSPAVSKGEWITVGAGMALAIILYVAGRLLPNERRKTIEKICKHFEASPVSHGVVRKPQ
jgi:hypothetical protein